MAKCSSTSYKNSSAKIEEGGPLGSSWYLPFYSRPSNNTAKEVMPPGKPDSQR